MSQENTQIVMRLFEAASKRDLATIASLLTPDTVWTTTYPPPFDGEYRGPEAAIGLLSRLIASFDVSDVEMQDIVAQGDLVVLILREKMRAKSTGKAAMNNAVVALKLRGGKITTLRMYGDSHALYEIMQPAPA